jgi:hypothetical protein
MSEQKATPPSDDAGAQVMQAYDQNQRAAEREHEFSKEYFNRTYESAIRSGEAAVRVMLIVNGGAALSLLTFIGGLAAQGKVQLNGLSVFADCLIWFACGVVCAAVVSGFTYSAAYYGAAHAGGLQRNWKPPYVADTAQSKRWRHTATFFWRAAILMWVASVIVFVCGMISVRHAILHLH